MFCLLSIRNRIRPIENKESAKVRKQAMEFNASIQNSTENIHDYRIPAKAKKFWLGETNVDDAFLSIDQTENELKVSVLKKKTISFNNKKRSLILKDHS